MALQIKPNNNHVQRKSFLAGIATAIFAIVLQPLVQVNLPAAFAAAQTIDLVVYPKNSPEGADESITFTNSGAQDVDLSGIYVTDQTGAGAEQAYFTVPANKTLPSGGRYTHTSGSTINNNGDTLRFYADESKTILLATVTTNSQGNRAAGSFNLESNEPAPVVPTPQITSNAPVLWDGSNYKGVNVDFNFKGVTDLQSATFTLNRADETTVVKTMKPEAIKWVNAQNGAAIDLTIPFVAQNFTYDEPGSGAWTMPSTQVWTKDSVPASVKIDFVFVDSSRNVSSSAPVNNNGINYESLLPAPAPAASLERTKAAYRDAADYKGITLDIRGDNFSDAREITVTVNRETGGPVVKKSKDGGNAISGLNGSDHKTTGMFVVYPGGTYNEAGSGSWTAPNTTYWDTKTVPTSIVIEVSRTNGDPVVKEIPASEIVTRSTTYAQIAPPVDTTGPTIANKTPAANTSIGGKAYKFSAVVTDAGAGVNEKTVYVRVKDESGKEYTYYMTREGETDTFSVVVDTTKIGDGDLDPRRISFRAVDNVGNPRSAVSDNVRIDNTGPIISNKTPAENTTIRGDKYKASATVTDISGVNDKSVYVRFRDDASDKEYTYYMTREGTTDVFSVVVDTTKIGDGDLDPRRVSFRAEDMLGNGRSSVSDNVRIDNDGPVLSDVTPGTGTAVNRDFTVSINAQDVSGVQKIALYVINTSTGKKSKEYAMKPGDSNVWTADVKLADLDGDEKYDLRFRAMDMTGNVTYLNNRGGSYLVNIDTTRAEVLSVTPKDGAVVGNQTPFTVSFDEKNGIKKVAAYLMRGDAKVKEYPLSEDQANTWTTMIETTQFKDGNYWLSLRAVDIANNVTYWNNGNKGLLDVVFDNTAPVVAFTAPSNTSVHAGSVEVKATVTDDNLRHYYYKVDRKAANGSWENVTSETVLSDNSFADKTIYTLPEGSERGEYRVQLAARDKVGGTDKSGNRSEDRYVYFTIAANQPPEDSSEETVDPDGEAGEGSTDTPDSPDSGEALDEDTSGSSSEQSGQTPGGQDENNNNASDPERTTVTAGSGSQAPVTIQPSGVLAATTAGNSGRNQVPSYTPSTASYSPSAVSYVGGQGGTPAYAARSYYASYYDGDDNVLAVQDEEQNSSESSQSTTSNNQRPSGSRSGVSGDVLSANSYSDMSDGQDERRGFSLAGLWWLIPLIGVSSFLLWLIGGRRRTPKQNTL